MKLVPDWRKCWHWHSIRLSWIGAALSGIAAGVNYIYGDLSPITKAAWPVWAEPVILGLVFLAVIVGRLLDQS